MQSSKFTFSSTQELLPGVSWHDIHTKSRQQLWQHGRKSLAHDLINEPQLTRLTQALRELNSIVVFLSHSRIFVSSAGHPGGGGFSNNNNNDNNPLGALFGIICAPWLKAVAPGEEEHSPSKQKTNIYTGPCTFNLQVGVWAIHKWCPYCSSWWPGPVFQSFWWSCEVVMLRQVVHPHGFGGTSYGCFGAL